jgi:cytoskeletal protein CcmA (bactofilin family)
VGGTADSTGNGSGNIDLNGKQQNSPEDTLPNEPAKVLDGVRAGGQANLSEGSVKNGVVADGDVDVDNSVVCGSVVSDGTIDIDKFSLIQEDRNASQDIGIDLDDFNIVTPTGELGTNFENFGTSTDMSTANQTIRAGSVIAGEAIDGGLQNSFVGGDVIAKNGDIDVPSSVICGDVVAENGAIDIYSTKTGPPLGLDLDGQQGGSRSQDRQRSLVGGVVRVEGEDFDIASATVFANGTTEPDKYDDDIAVLVTKKASGGNDSTITDGPTGGSILKGDVVVDGDLNVGIDGGSRVEGKVEANAGTVSLNDVTVTGPDPGAVDDDALIIGDGGEIDQLDGNATIQGNVRVKSGGRLDVGGPATIEGDLIVESGGTANRGNVTVEGEVIRN